MSTGAVGRSLYSNTTKRQAALERFVVGETRLARGSDAYLREEGQACLLSVQVWRYITVVSGPCTRISNPARGCGGFGERL